MFALEMEAGRGRGADGAMGGAEVTPFPSLPTLFMLLWFVHHLPQAFLQFLQRLSVGCSGSISPVRFHTTAGPALRWAISKIGLLAPESSCDV